MNIDTSSNIDTGLQEISPLIVDGDVAQHLVRGGAYEHFKGTLAEAKKIGQDFTEFIFQNRFEDVKVFF